MPAFAHRSLLFVPPADPRKLARANASDADALILDWEDGTARSDKESARRETATFCALPNDIRKPVYVRVNPVDSLEFRNDRDALQHALPDGVVVPKCASVGLLRQVATLLEAVHPGRSCMLVPLIETPEGLRHADEIAAFSPLVAAIGFGAEDFKAATEITPGPDECELLYARSHIVIAARAAGVEPVDSPCMHYRDLHAVEQSALRARRLGFGCTMAIHPAQIPVIHRAFAPSSAEVEQARSMIRMMESQSAGAVGMDGVVVDEPVLKRARRLLARAGLSE